LTGELRVGHFPSGPLPSTHGAITYLMHSCGAAGAARREGEAPAEPRTSLRSRLGRSLALPSPPDGGVHQVDYCPRGRERTFEQIHPLISDHCLTAWGYLDFRSLRSRRLPEGTQCAARNTPTCKINKNEAACRAIRRALREGDVDGAARGVLVDGRAAPTLRSALHFAGHNLRAAG
jgi:hypothetical protein